MKRIKRRIIAISTALVMALALVVSFVPTDVKATTTGYTIYHENGEVKVMEGNPSPTQGEPIATIYAESMPTNITGDVLTRTVNIKDLSCEQFFTSTFSSSDPNWTFVFEGVNTVNQNIYIIETCTIQVKPGGSLYTNKLRILCDTTLTLNQTTADKDIPETPFSTPPSIDVEKVTFSPHVTITEVSPTVTVPAGTKKFEDVNELDDYLTIQPEDGAGYTVAQYSPCIVKSEEPSDVYFESDMPLILEEGKEYYASVKLKKKNGYFFSVSGNTLTTTVNPQGTDVSFGKAGYSAENEAWFTVKFKVPKKEPTPPSPIPPTPTQHKFLNGDNQVVTYGQPVIYRLEGELSDYNGEGYIEVDGALVPAKYVAATKGSIILTLASDYVSGLKEGKHDVNIYFNDKSHVSTTFTLQSEPSSNTSDTTETTTPTTKPTSTPNTTTKVTAPKTSDNVTIVVVGIVTLTVGIGSVVAYRKHACKGKASSIKSHM